MFRSFEPDHVALLAVTPKRGGCIYDGYRAAGWKRGCSSGFFNALAKSAWNWSEQNLSKGMVMNFQAVGSSRNKHSLKLGSQPAPPIGTKNWLLRRCCKRWKSPAKRPMFISVNKHWIGFVAHLNTSLAAVWSQLRA